MSSNKKSTSEEMFCTRYKKPEWKTSFVSISIPMLQRARKTLSYSAQSVLLFIAENERSDKRDAKVSNRYIATGLNCSPTTVCKAITELEDNEFIERINGGYRIKYYSSYTEWDKKCPENGHQEDRKSVQKMDTHCPENGHLGVQKMVQREEGNFVPYKKTPPAGGEEDSPPQLRIVSTDIGDREYYSLLLEEQLVIAKKLNNVCIRKSFYTDGHIPDSFIPFNCSKECEAIAAKAVFVTVTNTMLEIQKNEFNFKVPVLPSNKKQAEWLGDAFSSCLTGNNNWKETFTRFYRWVLSERQDFGFNLLAHYWTDWLSEDDLMAVGYLRDRC